jgi:hypothetical protein
MMIARRFVDRKASKGRASREYTTRLIQEALELVQWITQAGSPASCVPDRNHHNLRIKPTMTSHRRVYITHGRAMACITVYLDVMVVDKLL